MVEALETKPHKVCEELGDVLLQVVLHAQLATERGEFTIEDVIQSISEKMIRRHPHVFEDTAINGLEDVLNNWETIKQQEEHGKVVESSSPFSTSNRTPSENPFGIPKDLPALQRSAKIGEKTQRVGFDWKSPDEVWLKVQEELSELEEVYAEDLQSERAQAELEHELGDVLFSVAQFARHLEKDPEQILRQANLRFESRYIEMLKICSEQNKEFKTLSDSEKEALWSIAKKRLKKP